jgi:hypothetical protein
VPALRGDAFLSSLGPKEKDPDMDLQSEEFPDSLLWFAGVAMILLCASGLLAFGEQRQTNASAGWTGDIVKVIDGAIRSKRRP